MYRYAMKELKHWKQNNDRKPLIIKGARQVGKTWLMKEFGKKEYSSCVYINCEGNKSVKNIFQHGFEIPIIIEGLEIESKQKISPETTLIILDEIQEIPEAVTSLKYFQEQAPEYHIISAGSLLGVSLHPGTSFPVGKVSFLNLFPLSFQEFLQASEGLNYVKLIQNKDWKMIRNFKDQYIFWLKQYYYLGGMPEVVAKFINNHDYQEARITQKRILLSFEQDFSKHAPINTVPRIRQVWYSIPTQLSKEKRKFVYSKIQKGSRAKEYEMAILWLLDTGLIHKVERITKPYLPPKAYVDNSAFKLFLVDVGLLGALSELDAEIIFEKNNLFTEFKGALTEQYVLQQLAQSEENSIYYWAGKSGSSEVDFVIHRNYNLIPIEVKSNENLQAKSLKVYFEKYHPNTSIRTSLSDYRKETWLENIPLYAI